MKKSYDFLKTVGNENETATIIQLLELSNDKFDKVYPQIKSQMSSVFNSKEIENQIRETLDVYTIENFDKELKVVEDYIKEVKEDEDLSENKKEFIISIIDNTILRVADLYKNPRVKVKVKVKKLNEEAKLPTYANPLDSGADVCAIESVVIKEGETKLVKTGLSMEIPNGYEIQVRPRSGMSLKTKFRIANAPGTIDSLYRGEICIIGENTGSSPIYIEKGDRIAQLIIAPSYMMEITEVEELNETERGENGFGSTGV